VEALRRPLDQYSIIGGNVAVKDSGGGRALPATASGKACQGLYSSGGPEADTQDLCAHRSSDSIGTILFDPGAEGPHSRRRITDRPKGPGGPVAAFHPKHTIKTQSTHNTWIHSTVTQTNRIASSPVRVFGLILYMLRVTNADFFKTGVGDILTRAT